ncbi:MAG: tRNA (adenosine(37)-N6)-dimethylallyltransferase MiaA [Bacteroidales bacterium]|nr:tRNA (adenosine(37)-N6)-dimethylallyltransferase MiaA [Bacteroidales bacterium]
MNPYNLLVILGPTAGGKTSVATHWAFHHDGEVISADSRQVYRDMNIGTGKDYEDYMVNGCEIPYHCIDVVDPGYQYNVYEYQKDFLKAFDAVVNSGKTPVLCGGSGLYIEAAIQGYRLIQVPVDNAYREELENKSDQELEQILAGLRTLHNRSDTDTRKRMIRAIEIARYQKQYPDETNDYPDIRPLLIGVKYDRESRRKRITERLKQRLDQGMVGEVQSLLDKGLTHDQLEYYGLEYKYLSKYLSGTLSYEQMFEQLNTAIHQFAKRQMTWFRRMERNGNKIWWLDGHASMEQKMERISQIIRKNAGQS